MSDAATLMAVLAGSGSVGGGVAWLLTLRQRRAQMTAAARDKVASADSRIMQAAAGIVEQAGAQVPLLVERITRLEADRDRLDRKSVV